MKRLETGKGSENVGGLEGEFFIPSKMPKKLHFADLENTAIPQFKIKITKIQQEKLSNTAIPQTPMPPSELRHQMAILSQFLFNVYVRMLYHSSRAEALFPIRIIVDGENY